jgi:HK97 family phage portal protein
MAADETAGKVFANGLQLSGFVETGASIDAEQRKDLMALFDKFTGSSRAGKVMPLAAGMKFTPLSFMPDDAQLLESRGFNVEDVCRWFDTPPILIGHSSQGQTMWGTGVGQVVLGWTTLGLDPVYVGHEQAIAKQLLSPAEARIYYAEFNREALMRADPSARAEFYSKLFGIGGMTGNMIADRENLPRFDGGDVRFVNSTLVPIDQAGKVRTQPAPGDPI